MAASVAAAVWACLVAACAAQDFLMPPEAPPPSERPGAVAPKLCGAGAVWRRTPLANHSTPNADFKPEAMQYWRTAVVEAAWPAAIGLGIALALLLLFSLWRCLRCCCGGCCCCCSGTRRKGQPKYVVARWVNCLKFLAALWVAGLAGSCAYGIVHVDTGLVGSGVKMVDGVKVFIANILNTARAGVATAESVGAVLTEVQGVMVEDVDTPGIVAQLECLVPWLDGLPQPTQLRADLVAANASVGSMLRPSLDTLSSSLSSLSDNLAPAPNGSYSAALAAAADSQAALLDPSTGLSPQAKRFVDATQALGASEDPEGLRAARDALSAFLSAPQPLPATLSSLQTALRTLQAAAVTDSQVPDAAAALASIRAVAVTVSEQIATKLRALQDGYQAATPCILDLVDRVQRINTTVLMLPPALQAKVQLLLDTKGTLDGFLNATASPAVLAAYLDAALPLSTIDDALQLLQLAEAARSQIRRLGLPGIITSLQAASDGYSSSQAQLQGAAAAMDSYMTSFYPAGGMPAGSWASLVLSVQSAGSAVNSFIGQVPDLTPVFSKVAAFEQVLPSLHEAVEQQVLGAVASMQRQLDLVPDIHPYLSRLDQLSVTYAALPQPPSTLATQAQTALEDLVEAVQQTVADAQAAVRKELGQVQSQIDRAEEQTVGRIRQYQEKYLPAIQKYDKIRLAALYALFGTACLFALLLLLSEVFKYPTGIKVMVSLCMLLMTLYFILAVALTAGLKVGNDGCVNMEEQIITRLPDIVGSPSAAAKAVALAQYYLQHSPPAASLPEVLVQAFGFDVDELQQRINATRQDLLQDISERYQLQPLLADPVGRAVELSYSVQAAIWDLLDLVGWEEVHPEYADAKAFVCCRTLNMLGSLWLSLILAGSFGLALCLLTFSFIASLDKLGRVKGCCACYKRQHFADEAGEPELQAGKAGAPGSPRQHRKINLIVETPRSPGPDGNRQFIVSWHGGRQEQFVAAQSGSGLRERFSAQHQGSPSRGGSGDHSAAASLGSSSGQEQHQGAGFSRGEVAAAAAAAAGRAELLGRASGHASPAGSRRGSPAHSPRASGGRGTLEAGSRAELSPARSATGSSSGEAAAGPGAGAKPRPTRFKSIFKD